MTSNYSAGVPIKKRRFPLLRPPSPPAEEQSVINDSLRNENSSPSQGSALSNAGISDAKKEEQQGNPDAKIVSNEVEQPSQTIHSVFRTDMSIQEKLVGAEKSANVIKSVKAEWNVAPIEAPALTMGTDLSKKQIKVENGTPELVKTPGITELSLAVREHVVSAMEGHDGERSHQNHESEGPVSLNFSLIRGNSNQCKGDNVDLNSNPDMHANRSNWDLNTTMDAWNGSVNDEASGQGTVDGCNAIRGTQDIKPLIYSVGICGNSVISKGQIFEKNKCGSDGAGQTCDPEDNLHLGLSPSFSLSCLSQMPSSSSAILNSSWDIANSGLGKALELTGSLNQISIRNVKSEPLEGSINHDFTGATPNLKGLPDIGAVKRELVERCSPESLKSFNVSALKLVDPRSIKPEPVREDIRETLKKTEGTLNQSDKQMVEDMDNQGKTTSSAILSTSGEVPNSFERSVNSKESHLSGEVPQEKTESSGQVISETMSTLVGLDNNAANVIVEVPCKNGLSREVPCENSLSREVPCENSLSREVPCENTLSREVPCENSLTRVVPCENNLSREVPCENNLSREVPQDVSENAGQVLTETASVGHDGNVSNIDTAITDDKIIDDTERYRLKFTEEVPPNSQGNDEGSASDDEEKINLSGDILEEDPYDSDYESDANHNLETAMDAEHSNRREEDFEDGEVRESLAHTEQEGHICEKRELQHLNSGESSDNKQLDFVGLQSEHPSTSSSVEDKPTKAEEPSETNNDSINKFAETAPDEKNNKGAFNKDTILQKPLAGGMSANEGDQKRCSKTSPMRPVVVSKRKDGLKDQETEQPYYQATSASEGNSTVFAQGLDENVKKTNVVEKSVSPLPNAEASLIIDDAAKDANNGGNKSRIINLSRASNVPSPSQTRTISGSSFSSRAGRERLTDVAIDGEILYPRGRAEIYTDASHKFSRERHQDHPSRNSRLNFVRGRGRISSRIDTLQGDWNSERDFAPEFYNGPAEFHVPRHKYASQPDPEFNGYDVGLNGVFGGIGRGGRKIINDEASVFHHLSRRRSPGVRVGPPGRGLDIVRRVPRDISSSGCIGEDGTELVGLRRSEKFIRGLPNDNTDPIYAHPQGPYEGLDGHFVRGNRSFLPMQRRGIPRIRSKSPIGSRTRSPGTWSPPRRRSPDRFGGHSELPNRRSPIYRMERMRSPDHSCFPGEMVVRRHGSPYMSRPPNELRDMDSSHDLGHPRSAMPNRSPSGRVLLRNTRRFDIADPHERTNADDYFGRPMHSGRFQELDADGTGEERRRFGERRGPVRPFRPPYNGAEGENFHINAGDGRRPFRFCPEDGPEFHERGNLREREFDRRIKNRPGNGLRRTRNIEEQEGNYMHGEQVWHDNGFDDMSRIKRKKF